MFDNETHFQRDTTQATSGKTEQLHAGEDPNKVVDHQKKWDDSQESAVNAPDEDNEPEIVNPQPTPQEEKPITAGGQSQGNGSQSQGGQSQSFQNSGGGDEVDTPQPPPTEEKPITSGQNQSANSQNQDWNNDDSETPDSDQGAEAGASSGPSSTVQAVS